LTLLYRLYQQRRNTDVTTETIHTATPGDEHSFDDFELADALQAAITAAYDTDGEAVHFVHLEDGRMISGVRVEKETLSDGSTVCAIYLATI
jgi:hypothetical protein